MTERPKDGADPDATVMLPAGGKPRAPDDDATVMIPVPRDDDATVMMPAQHVVPEPAAEAAAEPDAEATIAIPTPGRKRDADSPGLPTAPAAGSEAAGVDPAGLGGLNALVAAANPVLAVVVQIRHALKHPDPAGLRASLRQSIDAFEVAARASGASEQDVADASFALCALVDESAASATARARAARNSSTAWKSAWRTRRRTARCWNSSTSAWRSISRAATGTCRRAGSRSPSCAAACWMCCAPSGRRATASSRAAGAASRSPRAARRARSGSGPRARAPRCCSPRSTSATAFRSAACRTRSRASSPS